MLILTDKLKFFCVASFKGGEFEPDLSFVLA